MSKIPYNHKAIEKKWREKWEENPVNVQFDEDGNKKEKYYCLDMFRDVSLYFCDSSGSLRSDVWGLCSAVFPVKNTGSDRQFEWIYGEKKYPDD